MEVRQNVEDVLKNLQKNIISWYKFKENSNILEIGNQNVSVLNELGKNKINITSVLFSNEEKQNIEKSLIYKDKTELILLEQYNIKTEKKFDYIILIGVLEKSKILFNRTPEELIKYLKSFLKENGIFLIATDNKLGINNLCTEKNNNKENLLVRKKLEKILDNQELINRKFYYPLPNYVTPNVIFTDNFLPDTETISRCLTFYDNNTICALDEVKKFKLIIEDEPELFKSYTNSFLVECSCNNIEENNIKFVAFSNIRKSKYRIQTIIQGENVYKYNLEEESKEHLEEIKKNIDVLKTSNLKTVDTYEETRIISKYQKNEQTLDKIILEKIKNNKQEEIIELINKFKNELITNLKNSDNKDTVFDKFKIDYNKEDLQGLHFVQDGLWDLNFKNCFYINKELYFYDQEWYEKNVPVEFMIFRSILYFTELLELSKKVNLFDSLNITKKQIEIFTKLDNVLQENTRDEDVWNAHINVNTLNALTLKIAQLENDKEKILSDAKELLIQKDGRIKVLEDGMQEAIATIKAKEEEISGIVNSISWKLTKPFRKIKRKGSLKIKENNNENKR